MIKQAISYLLFGELQDGQDDKVLNESKGDKSDAHPDPGNESAHGVGAGGYLGGAVSEVDHHEEEGEEESQAARHCIHLEVKCRRYSKCVLSQCTM